MTNLTKAEYKRIIREHGDEAAFVANIIDVWQRNPLSRLRGLVKLLQAGRDVRTGPFNYCTLLVDGAHTPWTTLETA